MHHAVKSIDTTSKFCREIILKGMVVWVNKSSLALTLAPDQHVINMFKYAHMNISTKKSNRQMKIIAKVAVLSNVDCFSKPMTQFYIHF